MELSTTLLKRGAEAGLTLFDIASVMTRPFESGEEEPSELERTAATAKQALEQVRGRAVLRATHAHLACCTAQPRKRSGLAARNSPASACDIYSV